MKLLFACITMLMASCCFSQGRLTGFKSDGTPEPKIDQSDYFTQKLKENDSTYVIRTYRTTGPMIKWETFRDGNFSIKNGMWAWYDAEGYVDSSGLYFNNKKYDYWGYLQGDSGRNKIYEKYENGVVVETTNYTTRMITYADGRQESIDKPAAPVDTLGKVFTVVQVAAVFKDGGINGWTKYLSTNVKTPERFMKLTKGSAKATVEFIFIIEPKYGRTSEIFITRSQEFSVDMETLRVIKASPPWTPATQNGKNVVYRHRQRLIYQVSDK